MKLAVIYDSKTGNTKQAAEWIAQGMMQEEGVEAQTFHISDVDEAFVNAAKGVVIGSPSYCALMTRPCTTGSWKRHLTLIWPESWAELLQRCSTPTEAARWSFSLSSPMSLYSECFAIHPEANTAIPTSTWDL